MELRERFSRLYLGVVYDALRFDLNEREPFVVHRECKPIYPLRAEEFVFGPAFTCRGERVSDPAHVDDAVRIRMFQSFTPGCVQVIDAGGDDTVAHFGDISGKLARKFGAVGAVIDGYSRDARIIEQDRFPVFCRGTQPTDAYGKWQIVAYQVPVFLAGPEGRVKVCPGDYVYADPDGVIVIRAGSVAEVCRLAEARVERENLVRRELRETSDIQALYDRIGRW
ncbi:MAG TPA: RraA family protein [Polyangiaceae bacterium]